MQAVDILCITETHFEVKDAVDTKMFWKEKYGQMYRRDRQGRKGGGVIVVVGDKYASNHLHIVSPLEVVGVEVYCPNKVVILCFYVPPGLNKSSVSKEIERIVQDICHKTDQIIAVGRLQ